MQTGESTVQAQCRHVRSGGTHAFDPTGLQLFSAALHSYTHPTDLQRQPQASLS